MGGGEKPPPFLFCGGEDRGNPRGLVKCNLGAKELAPGHR